MENDPEGTLTVDFGITEATFGASVFEITDSQTVLVHCSKEIIKKIVGTFRKNQIDKYFTTCDIPVCLTYSFFFGPTFFDKLCCGMRTKNILDRGVFRKINGAG